jgi:hypothetical protein
MKPLDGGARVEVTMLTRMDLKIPFLPNWLFDMVSKKMAPNTIPMLAKQVHAHRPTPLAPSEPLRSHPCQRSIPCAPFPDRWGYVSF